MALIAFMALITIAGIAYMIWFSYLLSPLPGQHARAIAGALQAWVRQDRCLRHLKNTWRRGGLVAVLALIQ